jgi:hypothetical protein
MKTLFALCFALAPFAGCTMTPTQTQALGYAEIGNAYATHVLKVDGAAGVKALQDLSNALPMIVLGKVGPMQLGVINAELMTQQNSLLGSSSDNELFSQIGSLISLVSQSSSAAGGNPTAEQGILEAQALDAQNGINNAILFWQGQQSVLSLPAPGPAK